MPKGQRQLTGGENNPRFARFAELYIATGNARQSAVQAGYSESYAEAYAYKLAFQVRVKAASALRAAGGDEVQLARVVVSKLTAKSVKWNPEKKVFEEFDDHAAQLKAAEMGFEILEAVPRGNQNGNGGTGATPVRIVFNCPRPVRTPPTIEAKT